MTCRSDRDVTLEPSGAFLKFTTEAQRPGASNSAHGVPRQPRYLVARPDCVRASRNVGQRQAAVQKPFGSLIHRKGSELADASGGSNYWES